MLTPTFIQVTHLMHCYQYSLLLVLYASPVAQVRKRQIRLVSAKQVADFKISYFIILIQVDS